MASHLRKRSQAVLLGLSRAQENASSGPTLDESRLARQIGPISDANIRTAILDALNSSAVTGLTAELEDENLLLLCRVFKPKKDDLISVGKDFIRSANPKIRFLALTSLTEAKSAEDGQLFYVLYASGNFTIKNHWSMGELLGIEVEPSILRGSVDETMPQKLTLLLGGVEQKFLLHNVAARDEVIVNLLQTCELVFSHSVNTRGVDVGALMGKAQTLLRKNPVLMTRLGLGTSSVSQIPILDEEGKEIDGQGLPRNRGVVGGDGDIGMQEEEKAATDLLNSYDWKQKHVPDVEKAINDRLEALEYDTVKFLLAWEPHREGDIDQLATAQIEGSKTEAHADLRRETSGLLGTLTSLEKELEDMQIWLETHRAPVEAMHREMRAIEERNNALERRFTHAKDLKKMMERVLAALSLDMGTEQLLEHPANNITHALQLDDQAVLKDMGFRDHDIQKFLLAGQSHAGPRTAKDPNILKAEEALLNADRYGFKSVTERIVHAGRHLAVCLVQSEGSMSSAPSPKDPASPWSKDSSLQASDAEDKRDGENGSDKQAEDLSFLEGEDQDTGASERIPPELLEMQSMRQQQQKLKRLRSSFQSGIRTWLAEAGLKRVAWRVDMRLRELALDLGNVDIASAHENRQTTELTAALKSSVVLLKAAHHSFHAELSEYDTLVAVALALGAPRMGNAGARLGIDAPLTEIDELRQGFSTATHLYFYLPSLQRFYGEVGKIAKRPSQPKRSATDRGAVGADGYFCLECFSMPDIPRCRLREADWSMPAPAAQSLEKEDPNASRGAKGGIKRSRRARISRRPRELDRQRALGFRLGSPLFHSQPSVAGCFAVGLETIVYILDREARFVRDFLRINPEDIKDGYHLVDTTRETEEERRKKLLDKYLKYQFSSLLSRSDVGLAEALMRPDEPSVKRLPEAFACLLLVSHALERHNNAVEAQKKNIDLAPPVEETSRKSAMRTLTRANRHRSRFGTMRQARASTLKRPGAAPAAPAANSWLLVSEAVAPIVTEFLVNLQLRLQIKVTDALNKACEWVAGQPPPNLKRAGILAPVAKLPHYVDVVLLAGALADDASSFASDLLNSSRTPRISSTDRNSSSFDNVARRGSGNKVDGGHGILLIGNQPDYFLRTLTGMDGGEAPSMFRDDQKGRRSNRRGALPNMQEAREANMSAGGSGGLDVVATLLSKLTTRVVQWLEEVADRPSNAKYKQIGLIENYTFLHRTMAQRGLVCLNDFVAQCETRANSHAETYLNWSLNYEFPNLTKFWREVEDIVKERGMPAVMQSVPKAKYAKMKAEHPPEKVRNGLREVHSRLGKHCTAEEGFLRAQLWRRLIDKILTSWSRWEELASVCYQDESFHVTSQQIHRWLSEIHQS